MSYTVKLPSLFFVRNEEFFSRNSMTLNVLKGIDGFHKFFY